MARYREGKVAADAREQLDDEGRRYLALGRLVRICAASYGAQAGARKATIAKLESTDLLEVPLLRGAWTIAYWCGKEFANVRDFGFCLAV